MAKATGECKYKVLSWHGPGLLRVVGVYVKGGRDPKPQFITFCASDVRFYPLAAIATTPSRRARRCREYAVGSLVALF